MNLRKPERVRVPEYREWLATQPCCCCALRVPAVGHHMDSSGVGTKGSDLLEVPLCSRCHQELHTVGARVFADRHLLGDQSWLWREACEHLARWMLERGLLLRDEKARSYVVRA